MSGSIVTVSSLTRHLGDWRGGGEGVAYRSLAEALKRLVLDGRLPLNARLPGERRLATGLGVSRITVGAALDRLRAERFVVSRIGAGSYTALPFDRTRRVDDLFHVETGYGAINMATAVLPAGEHVHAAYARALQALPAHLPGHGYEPLGIATLRRVIADRYDEAGLRTSPEQILVTTGAQNALAHLIRAFGRPGEAVVIDHPTYPHAIEAILRAGLRPVPVALTPSGWDVEGLVAAIARIQPRLIYLIGAHHNPTGQVLSAEDEAVIALAAHRVGALLVMDDTLRDIWFDRPPPPPAAPGPHTVRLGSTSKTWWGGLRIGWIRADADAVAAVARSRASMDLGAAVVEQLAAAVLLAGDPEPVILRRRDLAQREAQLSRLLAERLPDWTTVRPAGGLSHWVTLPRAVGKALAVEARRHDLLLVPGGRFGVDGAFASQLRLPFTLGETDLDEAVTRLARAWTALETGGRASRRDRTEAETVF